MSRTGWLVAAVLAAYALWIATPAASASWPTLTGRASMFGDDPLQAFHDRSDNGVRAIGGPTSRGGIAVDNGRTLGGWWWVCAPSRILAAGVPRCHLVRQTDRGPARWTLRVLDVTAVTARRAWKLTARGFPTDVGTWTLRYRGRRR